MFLRAAVTFLFLCVVGSWLSSAFAATHGHHHGQHGDHSEIVSPFDKKQGVRSEHCAINSHAHYGFCPHDLSSSRAKGLKIAPECGGTSSGTVPSNIQNGKNLVALSAFDENFIVQSSKKVWEVLLSYDFHLIDPLAPPPRFI